MGRIRYSLDEARIEAMRLAEAFVASRPDRDKFQLHRACPDSVASPSRASKHPVAWIVMYTPIRPEGVVIDGGELFVAVDLEQGTVGLRPW